MMSVLWSHSSRLKVPAPLVTSSSCSAALQHHFLVFCPDAARRRLVSTHTPTVTHGWFMGGHCASSVCPSSGSSSSSSSQSSSPSSSSFPYSSSRDFATVVLSSKTGILQPALRPPFPPLTTPLSIYHHHPYRLLHQVRGVERREGEAQGQDPLAQRVEWLQLEVFPSLVFEDVVSIAERFPDLLSMKLAKIKARKQYLTTLLEVVSVPGSPSSHTDAILFESPHLLRLSPAAADRQISLLSSLLPSATREQIKEAIQRHPPLLTLDVRRSLNQKKRKLQQLLQSNA